VTATLFPTVELLEHQFTEQVIGTKNKPGIARQVGFRVYHTYRSKRSEPGWPDWALVRERFITLELKTSSGKVSDAQKAWGRDLISGGVEFYIPRPADLDLLALILSSRENAGTGLLSTVEAQAARELLHAKTVEAIA
jgi:hypothetical protein